jgi:hypothetical protein
MAITQTDIDALNTAIATGERQVTLGSQQITYRSVNELISARDDLTRQMAKQTVTTNPKLTKLYMSGRGY